MPSDKGEAHGDASKRSSLRVRGLVPQLESDEQHPHTLQLPVELRVMILEHLEKADLKRMRLVSREWSSVAVKPLFDRVYISPREKDIEVFEKITQHPELSAAVKELIYDASHFPKLERSEYFALLCENLACVGERWRCNVVKDCEDFREFLHDIGTCREPPEMHYLDHGEKGFVGRGFEITTEIAEYEASAMESGSFTAKLRYGLCQLPNLRSVIFSSGLWAEWFESIGIAEPHISIAEFSGSPLMRSWDRSFMFPKLSTHPHQTDYDHFLTLTQSIAQSQHNISIFNVGRGGGFPLHVFGKNVMDQDRLGDACAAFSMLEVLDLSIGIFPSQGDNTSLLNSALPAFLSQMQTLKSLHLNFKPNSALRALSYSDVFLSEGRWPKLTDLSLSYFGTKSFNLMHLINDQLPKLGRLSLRNISLYDGPWEGIIEGLRRRGLMNLKLGGDLDDLHFVFLMESYRDIDRNDADQLRALERYVEGGGRHPCLLPEQDDTSAEKYYDDMANSWIKDKII